MHGIKNHPVPAELAASAHINRERYDAMYKASVETPDQFWSEQAKQFLQWDQPWNTVREFNFHTG